VGPADVELKIPDWHWNWMVVSPNRRSEEAKTRKRLGVVKSWKAKMEAEARRETLRLQNLCQLEGVQDPTSHIGDNQLKAAIQNLGLLRDVALYLLDEMQPKEKNPHLWPRLQRISIYRSARFGVPLKKEVERLLIAGKKERALLSLSTITKHSHAVVAMASVAVLVLGLGLPTWSLLSFSLYYFLLKDDSETGAAQ